MILTTTSTLQDKQIIEYYGVVSGEAILGANIFRDFMAGIRDVVGGRSAAYEKSLREAKDTAFKEMEVEAAALGANAIIGIDLDYETISLGGGGGMLMVAASGTAVRVSE
ncbi:MAG: heavy metal-binding domain-containing protein [Cyanobacteriota bacterium]|nr:heavy metal-binding domain-containing protein [Cyanobacteriota bacterium]